MGYFPNGTSGDFYEEAYCNRCVHRNGGNGRSGCAVWLVHLLHNYKECNNKDSILHILIPRDEEGENERCSMFVEGPAIKPKNVHVGKLPEHVREWAKARGIEEVQP